MKNPNQTFHQEQEAKTLIISSRPSHPALEDPSGNVLALSVCISYMTFMPAEVGGLGGVGAGCFLHAQEVYGLWEMITLSQGGLSHGNCGSLGLKGYSTVCLTQKKSVKSGQAPSALPPSFVHS